MLQVVFYCTEAGNEPVREWLLGLSARDRRAVGLDLKRAQYGWPLGLPLVRKLESRIWEVRSVVDQGTARVLFTVEGEQMVLLHGFAKKSKRTPLNDLRLARRRLAESQEGGSC